MGVNNMLHMDSMKQIKKQVQLKKNRRMLVLSFCVPPDFRFY